jgi:hypothetical protein
MFVKICFKFWEPMSYLYGPIKSLTCSKRLLCNICFSFILCFYSSFFKQRYFSYKKRNPKSKINRLSLYSVKTIFFISFIKRLENGKILRLSRFTPKNFPLNFFLFLQEFLTILYWALSKFHECTQRYHILLKKIGIKSP